MAIQLTSRLIGLTISLATAILLVSCSSNSFEDRGVRPAGAISVPQPHGYGGIVVEIDETFTDAFENLQNHGSTPIRITGFELIDTPKEIELVDVLLAGDQREANVQWEENFPPVEYQMGPLVPAIGAELLPIGEQSVDMGGYSLIVGMKVTSPGKWIRGGYRIEFLQDGITYSNEVVAQITICTRDSVRLESDCGMEIPNDN